MTVSRVICVWFALIASATVGVGFTFAADRSQITVNDTREFPESITSTKDGAVFFGSISKGMIYRAAPGSAARSRGSSLVTGNLKNVLGVFADERGKTLWVCSIVRPCPVSPNRSRTLH